MSGACPIMGGEQPSTLHLGQGPGSGPAGPGTTSTKLLRQTGRCCRCPDGTGSAADAQTGRAVLQTPRRDGRRCRRPDGTGAAADAHTGRAPLQMPTRDGRPSGARPPSLPGGVLGKLTPLQGGEKKGLPPGPGGGWAVTAAGAERSWGSRKQLAFHPSPALALF